MKKELGVHNQIGKHVGHFIKRRKGCESAACMEFIAWYLGARVGKLMRDGYYDHLRDTADVTCNDRSQTKWYEGTISRLHHL